MIDSTLQIRLAIGIGIFAVLAFVDLHHNGKSARRWREYAFLLTVTCIAMLYGAVNDLITSAISWEYFYYGKELSTVLGPQTPPAWNRLAPQAMLVGIKATWTAGLLLGAVLLMANNPRPGRPPLACTTLLRQLPILFLSTIAFAAVGGAMGYAGLLNWCSNDFRMIARENLFRPAHFMATWGVHIGGYAGGLFAAVGGVIWIRSVRQNRPA
jgi:hypothetical protein